MNKPKLRDLCCKAGGASEGYAAVGFDVSGVDIEPQPNYPYPFVLADALTVDLSGYDAYHVSPPCQGYSRSTIQWRKQGKEYPDLIDTFRQRLLITGKPFVIENVKGAPLHHPVLLTGAMFGLHIKRDRYFECHGFEVPFSLSPVSPRAIKMGRPIREGDILQPIGHFSGVDYARREMELPGRTQAELAEALPKAYTFYLGKYLLQAVLTRDV